jgi:hypothetical protein
VQVVEQRRKLPPVLNDKALFMRAAPFGDRADQAYHAPSNRIGVYYSPSSMAAAAQLFEQFPQVNTCCRWTQMLEQQLSCSQTRHAAAAALKPHGSRYMEVLAAAPTAAAAVFGTAHQQCRC